MLLRRTIRAALTLAVLIVVAGCNEQATDPEARSADPATTGEGGTGSSELEQAEASDGTLTVAVPADVDNFDAHTSQLQVFQYGVRLTVFDTLFEYDDDMTLVPSLVEDYEVTDDASGYTFQLRDDVLFHDGTPFDADAVIANLERARDANSVFVAPLQYISRMEAIDDRTVRLELSEPYAPFLDALIYVAMIAPGSFDIAVETPVGTGPFVFEEWVPNERISMTRNDDYWGDLPSIESLELRPISDPQVAYTNLVAGDVDIVVEAPQSLVQQVRSQAPAEAAVYVAETSSRPAVIEFNGGEGGITDASVRNALLHALDRDAVNEVAYGGDATLSWSALPESSWAWRELDGYQFDLDRAAALLNDAGLANAVFQLEMPAGFAQGELMARVWQEDLAEIGVTLEVNVSEVSTWLDLYNARDYQMTWNVAPLPPEPHTFFEVMLAPHLEDWYQQPEVEEGVAAGIATSEQMERADVYSGLQEQVLDDAVIVPIAWEPIQSIVGAQVQGFRRNALGWTYFDDVTVATG